MANIEDLRWAWFYINFSTCSFPASPVSGKKGSVAGVRVAVFGRT